MSGLDMGETDKEGVKTSDVPNPRDVTRSSTSIGVRCFTAACRWASNWLGVKGVCGALEP